MVQCSVCRREYPREHLTGCSECGDLFCTICMDKDETMEALGICSDCEEVHGAEEELE